MTLCNGQLHPITVYRTVLGCALFCCWVSLGAHFINFFIEFYFIMIFIMIVVTIIGILWPCFTFWTTRLGFRSVTKYNAVVLVLQTRNSLDVSTTGHSRWILYSTCYLRLYAMFIFPTGYSTGELQALQLTALVACGVWRRGLTACLLYVGPLFGNLV